MYEYDTRERLCCKQQEISKAHIYDIHFVSNMWIIYDTFILQISNFKSCSKWVKMNVIRKWARSRSNAKCKNRSINRISKDRYHQLYK